MLALLWVVSVGCVVLLAFGRPRWASAFGVLGYALCVAHVSVALGAPATAARAAMGVISPLNVVWGEGLEAVVGVAALVGAVPALWWAYLPRYTAICAHDGQQWLELPGVWSCVRGVAGGDLEPYTKQWLGQALTGRFLRSDQARLPVNPKPRRHHVTLWGPRRGVFYVVGVRVFDEDVLNRFGRTLRAPVRWEDNDEHLPL